MGRKIWRRRRFWILACPARSFPLPAWTDASSPFRYFLESLLRISPVEDLERDPETWLSPRDFGSLLHEVLQIFMQELCDSNLKPGLKTHLKSIEKIAKYASIIGARTYHRQTKARFSASAMTSWRPAKCFSGRRSWSAARSHRSISRRPSVTRALPLPEFSIALGHGRRIRMRGRIDRVDRDDREPLWDVWDYKSGSTYKYEDGGRFARGTRIQHAIYARAVEAILAR